MSVPGGSEEDYERHHRRVCPTCGHSYVWHRSTTPGLVDAATVVLPGCGVRGCGCTSLDPEDL